MRNFPFPSRPFDLNQEEREKLQKEILSKVNIARRLQWCKAHKYWTIAQWRRVVWSDESPFGFRCAQKFRVWGRSNEKYHPECIKATVKNKKINFWGCFAAHAKGRIYKINGIMDQNQFHESLFIMQSQVA